MSAQSAGMLFALGSMFCYAINILITRVAIQRAPVELGFVALLCANIGFAGLVFLVLAPFRETTFALDWSGIGWFALSGLAGIYFGRRALLDAVRVLGPSRASVLHTASPVSTLLAAWILVGERLGPYELSLMAVVICGLWLTQPRAVAGAPHDPDALRRGVMLGVVTVACFGVGNAIRGIAIRTWDEPAAGAVVGSLAALIAVLLTTRDHRALATRLLAADRRGLALYALGGVITVIGTMLGSLAMVRTEIAVAMLVTYITPVVVFPVSVFILKTRESITGRTLVGAALVLGGVAALAAR